MKKWIFVVSSLLLLTACDSKLETGYEPNKLDMSLAQRKALYADPFSPQAAEAKQGGGDDNGMRSPARQPGTY